MRDRNISFREIRFQERRREILQVTSQLFREKGYHGVTIEEIANSMKLTKASLYYYVKSKEELLLECHHFSMQPLTESAENIANSELDTVPKMRKLLHNHIVHMVDDIYIAPVLLQNLDALPENLREVFVNDRNYYDNIFKQVYKQGVKERVFFKQNPTLITYFIIGALNSMPSWYFASGPLNFEEIAEFFIENIIRMISK